MTIATELQMSAGSVRALFEAAACSIALASPDGSELRFVAADGAGADGIVGVSLPIRRGIAGWVAMTGQAIAVADVTQDDRFARDIAEATDYVPTTILAAPLLDDAGETLGVIEVLDPHRTPDDETRIGGKSGTAAELETLTVIAAHVATAVRLSESVDAASHLPIELVGPLRDLAAAGPDGVRLAGEMLESLATYTRRGR